MGPAGAKRFRHRVGPTIVLGPPLVSTGRAFEQLPLVTVKDLQKAVVPLGRGVRPGNLQTTAERVLADAGALRVVPAQSHLLQGSGFGLGPMSSALPLP